MERFHLSVRLACAGLLGLFVAAAQAPSFIRGPVDATGTVGEPLSLSAEVSGATPRSVQWYQAGLALAGATNLTLNFTNLVATNTGIYRLTVTNAAGSLSTNVTLVVFSTPARWVYTGALTKSGSQVTVPLRFVPNGIETGVRFSVKFDPAVFSAPAFQSALAGATVNTSLAESGDSLGITLNLAEGARFAVEDTLLGSLRFTLAEERSLWDGRLAFTTNPVTPAAFTSAGTVGVDTVAQPQITRIDALPVLNRQTGLFHQRLLYANGTGQTSADYNLLVLELKPDARANAVVLYNAVASQRTDVDQDGDLDLDLGVDCVNAQGEPCAEGSEGCGCAPNPDLNGDGTADFAPLVSLGGLKAGDTRELLLEYFVKDLVSVPHPRFSLQAGAPVTNQMSIRNREIGFDLKSVKLSAENRLMVQFLTTTTNRYFIQYVNAVTNWNNPTNIMLAQPPVSGNGSWVQWIDQGPPKTAPLPTNNQRFYRVFEGF